MVRKVFLKLWVGEEKKNPQWQTQGEEYLISKPDNHCVNTGGSKYGICKHGS